MTLNSLCSSKGPLTCLERPLMMACGPQYRGTSLIRNNPPPPGTTIGPWAYSYWGRYFF